MKSDGQLKTQPNYTRRMLWVFAGQMMLVAALFVWSDVFPTWLNRLIMLSAILFPPLAYLTVLTRPSMRQAWFNLLLDSWTLMVSIVVAFIRLFSPAAVVKLVRFIASIKPMPTTTGEWITFCVLPFKTCIVAAFPMIWTFEKIAAHTPYFRPYGRTFGLSFNLIFESYLISLLALLLGALVQAVFCRAGCATNTLRFFLFGLVLLFVVALIPRAFLM